MNKLLRSEYQGMMLSVVLAIILSMALLSSCTLESSDNGDLDGFWHLESIDSLQSGKTVDVSNQKIFWGVEYKMIAARKENKVGESFYFRFEQTSDSLKITKVYIDHWHQDQGVDGGDIPLGVVTDNLRLYGVNAIPEGFAKEALSGSKMILRSKTVRLNFRKF